MKNLFFGLTLWMASFMVFSDDLYIGLLAQGRHVVGSTEVGKFKINVPQFNLVAGSRLNKYFGLEIGGVACLPKLEDSLTANLFEIHADVLGFYPIIENKLDLLGGIGLGQVYSTLKSDVINYSFFSIVPRATVGVDLYATESVKFRIHGTVEKIDNIHLPVKYGKNTVLFGVGTLVYF